MPASTDLAAQQQAAQAGLVTVLVADLPAVWALLEVDRIKATLPDFVAGMAALVQQYGKMAAAVAARFYARQRQAAGIAGRFRPAPADPPGLEQVTAGVEWATRGLWTAEPDVPAARTLVLGVAEKAVLDTGRDTTRQAVIQDREAKGWHRVIEPGACAFCLMLAIRGPVYKRDSFDAANARFAGLGEFKTHNACRCDMQPIFTAWEPTAEVRHWQSVYRQVARGKSSKDKRIAFRQAVEGRLPAVEPATEPATASAWGG